MSLNGIMGTFVQFNCLRNIAGLILIKCDVKQLYLSRLLLCVFHFFASLSLVGCCSFGFYCCSLVVQVPPVFVVV